MAYDRRASSLTSSENLSAPDAKEARANPAVLAATLPNAAASLRPEANAAIAICSPALIASSESTLLLGLDLFRVKRVFRGPRSERERDELAIQLRLSGPGIFKIGINVIYTRLLVGQRLTSASPKNAITEMPILRGFDKIASMDAFN